MIPHRARARVTTVSLLAASVAACVEPAGVRVSDVLGTYEATILMAGDDDVLAAGGSLTMTFQGNGLMFGTLIEPASAGGPITTDLTGTWTLVDRTLVLAQTADTFVKHTVWIWTNGVIEGTCCSDSTTITVRMERS